MTGLQISIPIDRSRRRTRKARRGIVLAIILAGMVLVLLMLGGLARRAVIEHRSLDSRAQSLQADWLLWSARQRAISETKRSRPLQSDWDMPLNDPALGKSVSARFLPLQGSPSTKSTDVQIDLIWTTASGAKIERSQVFSLPKPVEKESP